MAIYFIAPNHLADRGALELYADGEYYAIVKFVAVDTNNAPLPDGTIALIDDGNEGRNLAALDDDTPGSGRVVYLSDGVGAFKLLPSTEKKDFTLSISIDGQDTLTARVSYNDPTVGVYFSTSHDSNSPAWIDGIETGYARIIIVSDYIDINGNEFDVSGRPVTFSYTDEHANDNIISTVTNAAGIAQVDLGPTTSSFTYNVSISVDFSFTAGTRTIQVSESANVAVVFDRVPVVSLSIEPEGDYDFPYRLWADGRSAAGSRGNFTITISYDYNDSYFSSAQFDIDNPTGVPISFSAYDDEETLSIVTPVSGIFDSSNVSLTVTVGPSTKTTQATLKASITDAFTITFGNKSISYTDDVVSEFSINFVEPTFYLTIEFSVGDDPNNTISLDDSLFPTGSKDEGLGTIDLGDTRSFADNNLKFIAQAIISSDYDDVSPDATNLVNKDIKFESQRYVIDAFNDLVIELDPNNDDVSFMNFVNSNDILDSANNPQHTVYNVTSYDASNDRVSTYVVINKQPPVGDRNIYIKVIATTSFTYTFGTRTLIVDGVSYSGIVTFFPPAPRVSLDVQYNSTDPDDEENKLTEDRSMHLFSLVREGATNDDGTPVEPSGWSPSRYMPGKFTISATDYLGNALPPDVDIIISSNNSFRPLILNDVTTYTDRVCRFMFDGAPSLKDELYIIAEVTHNNLTRTVMRKVPYFNSSTKEFYSKRIFLRNISSITNGFINDASLLNSKMTKLGFPFGQTPLYDAVFEAAIEFMDKLRDQSFDNKFIVLISDGVDNFSQQSQQDAIDRVNSIDGEHKVRIYPVTPNNVSHMAKMGLKDFASDTGSYEDELLSLRSVCDVEDVVDIILNHNYSNISSVSRTIAKDFKDVIRLSRLLIDINIPVGYEVYIEARANSNSNSANSSDWSSWSERYQLISGSNTIVFSDYLVGRYFEFRITVLNIE